MATDSTRNTQSTDKEWLTFPGGELEGRRPRRLCPACLERGSVDRTTLCFQCYRLELDREKALKAAGTLNTATEARFQFTLPWEPVDVRRLAALKAVRAAERVDTQAGAGRFADRRRRAQIAARHALQIAVNGVSPHASAESRARVLAGLSHVAELQLPESWLPFVVG